MWHPICCTRPKDYRRTPLTLRSLRLKEVAEQSSRSVGHEDCTWLTAFDKIWPFGMTPFCSKRFRRGLHKDLMT
jgi:hypothetical protein